MSDIYQERYLKHQKRKREQLTKSVGEKPHKHPKKYGETFKKLQQARRSQRVFSGDKVDETTMQEILESAVSAPNSCNRHGIKLRVVTEQPDKDLLTGILVGGVGWIHRADTIVLFLADTSAYKSPNEKDFMHYCDVGFTAMNMWLTAESLNVGASYINPNIRKENADIFKNRFGRDGYVFCGALVLGNYSSKALKASQPTLEELLTVVK